MKGIIILDSDDSYYDSLRCECEKFKSCDIVEGKSYCHECYRLID